ncbi:MAG: hypothetical protein WCF81_19935, partial [Roseiarcus sp.]
ANAVLAAAGYNFRRILVWLAALWRALIMAVLANASDAAIDPVATPDRSNEPLPAANAAYFTVDDRGRQGAKKEVHVLFDRLLPHRSRRGPDGRAARSSKLV